MLKSYNYSLNHLKNLNKIRRIFFPVLGWRCPTCKVRASIRSGIFFTRSKLSLQKRIMLIHFWSRRNTVLDAAERVETPVHNTHSSSSALFQAMIGIKHKDTYRRWQRQHGGTTWQACCPALVMWEQVHYTSTLQLCRHSVSKWLH